MNNGEELKLDIPWQPDAVIAYKYILCEQCKAKRILSPDFNNAQCKHCHRKTYNWARSHIKRQGKLDESEKENLITRIVNMELEPIWMAFGMFASGGFGSFLGMCIYVIWLSK